MSKRGQRNVRVVHFSIKAFQKMGLYTGLLGSRKEFVSPITPELYGFDLQTKEANLARVAANVISGVGFLGAGTILREGSTIRGLTTASSIWIVASIGMLTGLGLVSLALYTTFLMWFVLVGVKRFKPGRKKPASKIPVLNLLTKKDEDEDDDKLEV